MKKLLAILLCLVLVLSLAACAGDSDSKKKSSKKDDTEYDIDLDDLDIDDSDIDYADADNEELEEWLDDNGDEFISAMEQAFATSSGLTCNSYAEVDGNGFVIDICINELDDIDQETKDQLQDTYDSMNSSFDTYLEQMQSEISSIEYFQINVCEKDGDVLAVIIAGDK